MNSYLLQTIVLTQLVSTNQEPIALTPTFDSLRPAVALCADGWRLVGSGLGPSLIVDSTRHVEFVGQPTVFIFVERLGSQQLYLGYPHDPMNRRVACFKISVADVVQEWGAKTAHNAYGASLAFLKGSEPTADLLAIGAPGLVSSTDVLGFVELISLETGSSVRTLKGGGASFGHSVLDIPDFDQGGVRDIAISEPAASPAGRIIVYSAESGAIIRTIPAPESSGKQSWGDWISKAGDWTNDGFDELFVSVAEFAGESPGVDIVDLVTGSVLRRYRVGAKPISFRDCYLTGASLLRDMNKDGMQDVLLAWGLGGESGKQAGQLEVVSGKNGARLAVLSGDEPLSHLGSSICRVPTTEGSEVILATTRKGIVRVQISPLQ